MSDDVVVAGHERWLPLDLSLAPDAFVEGILELFAEGVDGTHAHVTRTVAEELDGVAARLRERQSVEDGDGVWLMGAWALLEDPATLSPVSLATLRAVPTGAADPIDLVSAVTAGSILHDTPTPEELQTASGPATVVTLRYLEQVDGAEEVHEQHLVLWVRPEKGFGLVLSSYETDLSQSRLLGPLLAELAVGVGGA